MGFSVLVGNPVKKLLLVGFIFVASNSLAQTNIIDSLKNALKNSPNDKKIYLYKIIITKTWRNNPDSALIYSRRAIQFARETNDLKARAIAVRLQGGSYFYLGNYDSCLFFVKQACTLSLQVRDSSL